MDTIFQLKLIRDTKDDVQGEDTITFKTELLIEVKII